MFKIIKGTPEHCHLIAEIGKTSFLESHGESASKKEIDDFVLKAYHKNSVLHELENSTIEYNIIYHKNNIAGYSKIELDTPNANITYKNVTKLDRFYLLKEYYGLNLGARLLDFNIKLSKENQQKGIWLAVWIENQRAIKFYTKAGFKIIGKYNFQISKTHANPNHIMYLTY